MQLSKLKITIVRLNEYQCPIDEIGQLEAINPDLIHAQIADRITDVSLDNGEKLDGTWIIQEREWLDRFNTNWEHRLNRWLVLYVSKP